MSDKKVTLAEIEADLPNLKLPEVIQLSEWEKIVDVPFFFAQQIMILKSVANKPKEVRWKFMVVWDRLLRGYQMVKAEQPL